MKTIVMLLIVILLTACKAGNGDGLNELGLPLEQQPPNDDVVIPDNDDTIMPTLVSIQDKIFTPICSTCHGGANPAAGQDLSSIDNTISSLINVDSSNRQFKRVLPGSAEESYLYLKVTGDSRAGSQMPLGQPVLTQAYIQAIKQWIDEGALIPENAVTSARISRVSLPMTSVIKKASVISKARLLNKIDYIWQVNEPVVIVFWFNKSMNFDHLTGEQILFTASNEDKNFSGNSWLIASEKIAINIINDHTLQVNITDISQEVTRLNIQLNNSDISTLTTKLGQQLDGDVDDIDGGVFSYDIFL